MNEKNTAQSANGSSATLRNALKTGFIEGVQAGRAGNPERLWEDSSIRKNFDASHPLVAGAASSPIPLNAAQQQTVKEWAADDRLWTTQETVEFNLRTFARVILAAAAPAVEGARQDGPVVDNVKVMRRPSDDAFRLFTRGPIELACLSRADALRVAEDIFELAAVEGVRLDIEEFCRDVVKDARMDGEVVSLLVPRVVEALKKHGLLAVVAGGREDALHAVAAAIEQQLTVLDRCVYTVDVRERHGRPYPVFASVVDRSDALHCLLYVRQALRAALAGRPADAEATKNETGEP